MLLVMCSKYLNLCDGNVLYLRACCEQVLSLAVSVCLHTVLKTTEQKLVKLGRYMLHGEC